MNGRQSMIVVAVSLITASPAFAGDFNSAAFTPREMAHCIMKRLRTNTESYRDAYKACKDQFDVAQSARATDTALTAATLSETTKQ